MLMINTYLFMTDEILMWLNYKQLYNGLALIKRLLVLIIMILSSN